MAITSSIAFFSSYRPGLPIDIFSCSNNPTSRERDVLMTDGISYNYKGRVIPKKSLKLILRYSRVPIELDTDAYDVDSGRLTGIIFGSERSGLETLHIALRLDNQTQVFSFSDAFDTFDGVRMEDAGTFVGHYLVYISTMEAPPCDKRRQPWTAVFRTNLITGETDRLTPEGEADLSPSVSPSGRMIAVASFEEKGGWDGEIEDLQTDIFVMDLENPSNRYLVIRNGGWPSWGSDDLIYFHRRSPKNSKDGFWGVHQAYINYGVTNERDITRVTPRNVDCMTPAAISATKVAVAIIRRKSDLSLPNRTKDQYRHIEIFDLSTGRSTPLTQITTPLASHFNPFVLDGGRRIGYTRAIGNFREIVENIPTQVLDELSSPLDEVGLYRTQGAFPTISKDGSKLAFVDNEFNSVWLVDGHRPPRIIFNTPGRDNVFGPVWDPVKDTLYVCMGPSFKPKEPLEIWAIHNVCSNGRQRAKQLTVASYIRGSNTIKANNGFPFPNPNGTRLVFRSTRAGLDYKNLYIMEDTINGENNGGRITRLTNKICTDTQPNWSPNGDWIAFASNRDKDPDSKPLDNGLDSGYFAVYLVNPARKNVVIRVMFSAFDIAGHVNHPFFSPDGNSLVVTADVAGVCVEPISLPLFEHSVRPYGDIFTIELDTECIENNQDIEAFTRITHSRYENSLPIWTTHHDRNSWNALLTHTHTPGHATCPCPPMTSMTPIVNETDEDEDYEDEDEDDQNTNYGSDEVQDEDEDEEEVYCPRGRRGW